ncbi:MAG: transcriptional repressor [Parvularculaceae bacterium]|jgi:Fur family zinc uptake transcriptional regulator|nr:transcriptional repressor [Parvularculaceae bacterium]
MQLREHAAHARGAPSGNRLERSYRQPAGRNQRLVLEELAAAEKPLKAYDLLARLRERGVNSPMTVYRALGHLIAAGRVKKIASANAFLATRHPASAVMICRICGFAVESPIAPGLFEQIFGDGASVDSASIEAFGSCGCDRAAGVPRAAE